METREFIGLMVLPSPQHPFQQTQLTFILFEQKPKQSGLY